MDEYFHDTKKKLEEQIPEFQSADFKKMGDKIRKKLEKEESDFLLIIRSLTILVLGDWNTAEKKEVLYSIKNNLLKNGLYAETIDKYYDMKKGGGLTPQQILEICCINHQLIVFLDGEGAGTITEQNYICDTYVLHGKVLFFIDELKFDSFKNSPSSYIKDFPSIITYKKDDLQEKVLVFSRLRLYRLASIIQKQVTRKKGLHGVRYQPWRDRLGYRSYKGHHRKH